MTTTIHLTADNFNGITFGTRDPLRRSTQGYYQCRKDLDMAFYHVSGGRAYGPSDPGESLKDYRARVRKAYGSLHGVTFGTRDTLHPRYFYIYGISR